MNASMKGMPPKNKRESLNPLLLPPSPLAKQNKSKKAPGSIDCMWRSVLKRVVQCAL